MITTEISCDWCGAKIKDFLEMAIDCKGRFTSGMRVGDKLNVTHLHDQPGRQVFHLCDTCYDAVMGSVEQVRKERTQGEHRAD